MDLNQLLKHHQLALMKVRHAPVTPETMGVFDMVEHYARKIKRLRSEMGVVQYPHWMDGDLHLGHNK